jgi:hypothetical protein
MARSPLQKVRDDFGGREALVNALVPLVDRLHGEASEDAVRSRMAKLSNDKLLRLHSVEQRVRERFGDRNKLVDHIVAGRKSAGLSHDQGFVNGLARHSKARLLDLTRQDWSKVAVKTPKKKAKAAAPEAS